MRGGTTSQHNTFTGAEREVTVDTTKDTLVVHDGSTAGGVPLAKEADITTINTSLAAKADTTAVNTSLAAKADTTTVNTSLLGKAALNGIGSQNFSALTLNATTVGLGDWTITTSGSDLTFRHNGTARFTLSSSGALTVEDNITAYGNA
tara:strand:+ start:73 stop:519 length:447 start_codon:yes stop_codon:yes gene_type:complete